MTQAKAGQVNPQSHPQREARLGPILCWAVVFADIGTSVYYIPGILYGNVGSLAGFFVFLTMAVFVLLTLKYAEVTHRFPQGGGVVTVAAQAMNHWVGALGGMCILVDYFLTAAISSLSGILYLSVVLPAIAPFVLEMTIGMLVLLGLLNWIGVSASAKVSLVGATIAFLSDIALLVTVFTHLSFSTVLSLFPRMFASHALTPLTILIGFSASFLAFSGLESISQLSPVMKTPRKKVGGIALLIVVLTVGLTSPLLTMFSTLLLPTKVLEDPVLSVQVISLLGGHWGNTILQTEVAISASALLVFASNTAIIGTYYVFLALSRMQFFPALLQQRNTLRGTPHYAILLATAFPIIVLVLVRGKVTLLGDMYAFGLLGAFTLTCLGLDVVRHRERKAARMARNHPYPIGKLLEQKSTPTTMSNTADGPHTLTQEQSAPIEHPSTNTSQTEETPPSPYPGGKMLNPWYTFKFFIGLLTTALVFTAWTTNLVTKPLATIFGGTVTIVGMGIAYVTYTHHKRKEHIPVAVTHNEEYMPGSILAVLLTESEHNDTVIDTAITQAQTEKKPVVFLYLGNSSPIKQMAHLFEIHDPYYDDEQAQKTFGKVAHLAQQAKVKCLFLYRKRQTRAIEQVWRIVHPHDVVIAAEYVPDVQEINPDHIRIEITLEGKVAHLLKRW